MADDRTISIIIRASAQGFQQAVGTSTKDLEKLGLAAAGANQQLAGTARTGENLGNVLERSLFNSIGALSLIGAGAMEIKRGFSAAIEYIQSAIAYTTQFETEVNSLAIELSALGKTGGAGFAQDLEYATVANEKLRASVLGLGGDIQGAERLFHAFVAAGVVPDTQQGIDAIGKLQLILSTMVTSRRPMMTIQMEMLQLLDGEINKQNQIANILERKLHLSDEQLLNWIRQGIEQNNLADKMAAALSPGTDALEHWRNLLPQIQMHSKELGDEIKRAGMAQAYQDTTKAAKEYDDYLTSHKESLIAAHKSIATEIGGIELAWNKARIALIEFLGAMASGRNYDLVHGAWGPNGPLGQTGPFGTGATPRKPSDLDWGRISTAGIPAPADRPAKATDQPGWGQKGKGGGGMDEAFRAADDAVQQWQRHQLAVNATIDDAVKREADLVRILEQARAKYAEVERVATGKHAVDEARHAHDQLLELDNRLIIERHNLEKTAVSQRLAIANEYLAFLKATNQISLQDEISYLEREKAYHGLTAQQITSIDRQETMIRREIRQKAIKDAQTEFEDQLRAQQIAFDEQRADLQRQADLSRIGTEAARTLRGMEPPRSLGLRPDLRDQEDAIANATAQENIAQRLVAFDQQQVANLKQQIDELKTHVQDQQTIANILKLQEELKGAQRDTTRDLMEVERSRLDVIKAQVDEYKAMVAPITDATRAVAATMEHDISQALENAFVRDGTKHAMTFWQMYHDIGGAILGQVSGMLSKAIMQSLNIEPTLNKMFGWISGSLGGPKPEQLQQLEASIRTSVATQRSAVLLQQIVQELARHGQQLGDKRGGGEREPGGPVTPLGEARGPIERAPAGSSAGDMGWLGRASDILGIPQIQAAMGGGVVSGALSIARLLFRGSGGMFPGSFTPIAAFAGGGTAIGPTFGLVGEAGPEAVVPLRGGKIPVDLGRGGASTTVHFTINAIDSQDVAEMLHEHGDIIARVVAGQHGMNHPSLRPFRR